jgi:hypothetical protein
VYPLRWIAASLTSSLDTDSDNVTRAKKLARILQPTPVKAISCDRKPASPHQYFPDERNISQFRFHHVPDRST